MRVKIFDLSWNVDLNRLENEINVFLAMLPGNAVKHVQSAASSTRCRSGSGGNSVGVVSVLNLELSGVGAPERRPRHDKRYHEV